MEQGRIKILCDLTPTGNIEQDKLIIPKIIELTKPFHEKNVADSKRLREYYYNLTDIRLKTKTQQSGINNQLSVNYPEIAVSTINAYCFANPLTFSSRNAKISDDTFKAFNDALDDDNYAGKSHEMYFNSGITGLGYRLIVPATKDKVEQGVYFETFCDLKPEETYCVYSNDIRKDKICAINFYDKAIYDKNLKKTKTVKFYTVWTKYHQWEFYKSGRGWANTRFSIGSGNNFQVFDAFPLTYNRIPVVENVRKHDRTGDFELAINLINAINVLASFRVDAVQQSVDYIVVLRDIDTESEGALDKVKEALKEGIMSFKSIDGAMVQPNIDILDVKLNQSEAQTLQDFLCEKVEEVLNIPNRETRSSGGDTGSAVESRNGFRSLENIAGLVTASAMKTENETLDVILAICRNIQGCPFKNLKVKDIEVKENRNRVENLSSAATAYSTLRAAGMNDTDALIVTKIVSDPQSVAKKNKLENNDKEKVEKPKVNSDQTNNGITSGNTVI